MPNYADTAKPVLLFDFTLGTQTDFAIQTDSATQTDSQNVQNSDEDDELYNSENEIEEETESKVPIGESTDNDPMWTPEEEKKVYEKLGDDDDSQNTRKSRYEKNVFTNYFYIYS